MKELSIEEKAKRYDEAIEKGKQIQDTPYTAHWDIMKEVAEHLLPELKESEDEKIRKAIIEHFEGSHSSMYPYKGFTKEQILAWLEKQGEQKTEVKYVYTKFQIGDTIVEIKPNGYCQPVRVKYIGDGAYSCESDDGKRSLSFPIINQDDYELVAQKPDDKVEPKFKIGDIITNGKIIGKVDENDNNKYHGWFGYDKDLSIHYADIPDIENWHKWTIQDAKDGDVLFTSSTASHETFILKSIDEKGNAKCYFAYDSEDGFREGKYHFIGSATNCKPATKEQRDTLIKAMADAGYEWNAEKKELKKLEKPIWNEEDERLFQIVIDILDRQNHLGNISSTDLIACVRKLKSLRPQSNITDEELAQAKKDAYNDALNKIEYHSGEPTFDDGWSAAIWYLKKRNAMPQNQWKPSAEQMKFLWRYAEQNNYDGSILTSLYNDLKKLREK